jgi:pantoate--beta-alanine ligase
MRTITDPAEIHTEMCARRAQGERIGFVPTMGFLHQGHLSLMEQARTMCDHLVVSIYVNPLQFGPDEDLDRYPSDPEGDAAKCASVGVDTLFLPPSLYEPDHSTTISVADLGVGLCGANRPGHFDGVTTVVSRLFGLVQPSIAVFGEKDYQQLAIIRRMVRDLSMSVEIVGGTLVRDQDGLALSSRNTYLSPEMRTRALTLHKALYAMRDATSSSISERLATGRAILDVDTLDYLEIVDADSLTSLKEINGPARALVAGWIGKTRLIDNIAI